MCSIERERDTGMLSPAVVDNKVRKKGNKRRNCKLERERVTKRERQWFHDNMTIETSSQAVLSLTHAWISIINVIIFISPNHLLINYCRWRQPIRDKGTKTLHDELHGNFMTRCDLHSDAYSKMCAVLKYVRVRCCAFVVHTNTKSKTQTYNYTLHNFEFVHTTPYENLL